MEKQKLTKQSVFEMMNKIAQDREKAMEEVARHDGAMNFCKYLLDKFDLEAEQQGEVLVHNNGL